MSRIGIFGGTFNPPHAGHFIVASIAFEQLHLERLWFVPSAVPPHKSGEALPRGIHRKAMLEAVIAGDRRFHVSDIELQRGGMSYTVDTLEAIRSERPGDELYLLVGMDIVPEFASWKDPERILDLATVVILTRPGFERGVEGTPFAGRSVFCPVPRVEISSRDIRRRLVEGLPIRYLVPRAVEEYITEHGLYSEVDC